MALALLSTVGREDFDHPVICESPSEHYPPITELHLWREATDEEYTAYVEYWDAYYADQGE